MREKRNQFSKLLREAADEGLTILGESPKEAIYYHLESSYSLKREEIPQKPEAFADGLEKIFGAGAIVIEKQILNSLYSKLGLKYEEEKSYRFVDYIVNAKKMSSQPR